MRLGETQKRWARRLGYPVLALVTYVFALHFTFPYARLEELLTRSLSASYDVSGGSVGPGWLPGHLVVKNLTLKSRPELESQKPTEFTIDELELNLGLISFARGQPSVGIEATIQGGTIEGDYAQTAAGVELDVHTEDFPLGVLPGVAAATGGLPLAGGLNARLKLNLPKGKFKEAEGFLEIACEGCTIGDGVTKARPTAPGQSNAFSNEGFTLPKLTLGKVGGKIDIAKGVGKITNFEAKSSDGELTLDGEVRFDDPFKRSIVTAYLRFRSSDDLRQRESRMADMEMMMGAAGRRPDGYIGVRMTGPITQLKYQTSKIPPPTIKDRDRGAGRPERDATLGRPPNIGTASPGGLRTSPPERPTLPDPPPPITPPPLPPPDQAATAPRPTLEVPPVPPPPVEVTPPPPPQEEPPQANPTAEGDRPAEGDQQPHPEAEGEQVPPAPPPENGELPPAPQE